MAKKTDTPRTDAQAVDSIGQPHHLVSANFARTLERELTRYKRLEEILRDRADASMEPGDERYRGNAEMRVLTDWENS